MPLIDKCHLMTAKMSQMTRLDMHGHGQLEHSPAAALDARRRLVIPCCSMRVPRTVCLAVACPKCKADLMVPCGAMAYAH
jgi:hypothetical protein